MTDEREQNQPSRPTSSSAPREISSEELLRGEREVWIRHGNELYRLRHTRSGKLILQK